MSLSDLLCISVRRLVTCSVMLALLSACGGEEESVLRVEDVPTDWPAEFILGFFGSDDAIEVMENNEPIRAYLEQRLQIPVRMYTGTSYSAVIEAMRAGRVDAMAVGPLAYILAVEEAGAEALAVLVTDNGEQARYRADTDTVYFSAIITIKGSGIRTLEDLRGRDFNFVDPASMSGHLAPRALLLKHGIDPDRDMKTFFAGSHPTSLFTVKEGRSDAGSTMLGLLYRMQDEGLIDFCGFDDTELATPEVIAAIYDRCPDGHIVMLGLTEPMPSTPFAVRRNLPESFKTAVKSALLAVRSDPGLMEALPAYYVDPSAELGLAHLDQFYDSVRELARLLDLDLKSFVDP